MNANRARVSVHMLKWLEFRIIFLNTLHKFKINVLFVADIFVRKSSKHRYVRLRDEPLCILYNLEIYSTRINDSTNSCRHQTPPFPQNAFVRWQIQVFFYWNHLLIPKNLMKMIFPLCIQFLCYFHLRFSKIQVICHIQPSPLACFLLQLDFVCVCWVSMLIFTVKSLWQTEHRTYCDTSKWHWHVHRAFNANIIIFRIHKYISNDNQSWLKSLHTQMCDKHQRRNRFVSPTTKHDTHWKLVTGISLVFSCNKSRYMRTAFFFALEQFM